MGSRAVLARDDLRQDTRRSLEAFQTLSGVIVKQDDACQRSPVAE